MTVPDKTTLRIKPPLDARLFDIYAAISPHGRVIRQTVSHDPDAAWRSIRASVTDPDSLHDKGWRIARLSCHLEAEVSEPSKTPVPPRPKRR